MFKESIPCCYFPTKVIIIDDNKEFSNHLSFALNKKFHSERFASPTAALTYLRDNGELAKTLLNKYICVSEEQYSPSAVTVDVHVASLHEELYTQPIRFDLPVVLVVDYAMPGMNGLEFCAALADLPYKKIMLTGEADYDFAVEAFNLGKFDRFVKKTEENYLTKIQTYIQELNIAYFNGLSQSMLGMLGQKGQDVLHSSAFIHKFNEIVVERGIVEFYLADDMGSYIFLDAKGRVGQLILRAEDDMRFFAELAENDGMESMAEAIADGKKMPGLIGGEDGLAPAQEWTLCDANVLPEGDNTYYYAVIDEAGFEGHKEMPLSYQQYLMSAIKAA